MEINFERYFDFELKAFYDEGQDVSDGGEVLTFSQGGRALIYHIDDLTAVHTVRYKEVIVGVSQQARLIPVLSFP